MKKVGFITLGCKVNIYESSALKNELEARGFEVVGEEPNCDAYIINTCSVTNMADAKSRRMIRRAIKFNPDAVICAMGCYVQTNDEAKTIDGVDILVGNGNKKEVVDKLDEALLGKRVEKYINILDILKAEKYEQLGVTTYDHTRAFVKIEDGCTNFCSYCIIPYARGPVRCKGADDVIKELQAITENGYKEVVLAGIHTGRYQDGNTRFSDLVRRILNEVPKLERLRVSSIEPNEVDADFIEMMKNNKVIANHLHLPLQTGTDEILKRMNRRYDTKFYREKVEQIRAARPDVSITTDVIVGFPYETDELYEETKRFIESVGISKIHVFPYSVRKGTQAATMPQVNDTVKKNRALDLIKLSEKLENQYANRFIGQKLDVIVEQQINSLEMIGHTSNFLQVILPLNLDLIGERLDVIIDRVEGLKVYGKLI